MATRRQATLYLPAPFAATVERLRSTYNPAQYALIRAHITLCREDEVQDWHELTRRLRAIETIAVRLDFGSPVRADNLVYLPASDPTSSFDLLREALLARPGRSVRKQEPHITLIHPRNGTCSDEAFASILKQAQPFTVTLREVTLISQTDGGRWQDLGTAHG